MNDFSLPAFVLLSSPVVSLTCALRTLCSNKGILLEDSVANGQTGTVRPKHCGLSAEAFPSAEECDATGDTMKYKCRAHKNNTG